MKLIQLINEQAKIPVTVSFTKESEPELGGDDIKYVASKEEFQMMVAKHFDMSSVKELNAEVDGGEFGDGWDKSGEYYQYQDEDDTIEFFFNKK